MISRAVQLKVEAFALHAAPACCVSNQFGGAPYNSPMHIFCGCGVLEWMGRRGWKSAQREINGLKGGQRSASRRAFSKDRTRRPELRRVRGDRSAR